MPPKPLLGAPLTGVVEALDVLQHPLVVLADEVDGNTLAAEAARATDTVQVVLGLGGQVVVDDQRHLEQRPKQQGAKSENRNRAGRYVMM